MDFIWPPRLCCEIHHYSRCFAHPRCKTRSISDQIAKVQRLTANAKRKVFGNVKNADTLAPLSAILLCRTQPVIAFAESKILGPIEDMLACRSNRYFLP